jgi:DNA primase
VSAGVALIPEDIIQQVIDRTDIVELIGSYIPLKKAGVNFKGLCPFHHEKTPSFVVTPNKQIFHCFGCHEGGNVLGFVMKHERLDFAEAVRLLAGKAGIVIPEVDPGSAAKDSLRQQVLKANEAAVEYYHQNLIAGKEPEVEAARGYLKLRAVSLDCARRFRIGYAFDAWDGLSRHLKLKGFGDEVIARSGLVVPRDNDKGYYDRFRGRIIFSIFDYRGRAVAFGARALKKDDKAKYINSPETVLYTKGQHLYGLNWAKDAVSREDAVIIVEGYLDCLRPVEAGIDNVAASLGTALTLDQIRLIRRYTRNVIMLFDMDTAGQSATARSLDLLLEEEMNVRVAALADGEDPDSFILKAGPDAFRQRVAQAVGLFDFKLGRLSLAHNARTIEGRAMICGEMLPAIDKIPSEVVRDGYVRELARRLEIPEETVLRERRRLQGAAAPRAVRVEPAAAIEVKEISPDEKFLLQLMLADPRWVAQAQGQLSPEDFREPAARAIVGMIYADFGQGREFNAAVTAGAIDDRAVRSLLTQLVQDSVLLNDQPKIFADCLKSLRGSRSREERQRLRADMKQAEKQGDWGLVRSLQEKFNMNIKSKNPDQTEKVA